MAKNKPFHKIKIHKNRWLAWAISYVVIVTIAVVGYIKVSDINFDTDMSASSNFQPWHEYLDNRLGFSLRHPADWSIRAINAQTVEFLPADVTKEGVGVSVFGLTAEKAVRASLDISSETPIAVDGVIGTRIISDMGHRAVESVVLAKFNKKLYVISGPDNLVQDFVMTFHFINTTAK